MSDKGDSDPASISVNHEEGSADPAQSRDRTSLEASMRVDTRGPEVNEVGVPEGNTINHKSRSNMGANPVVTQNPFSILMEGEEESRADNQDDHTQSQKENSVEGNSMGDKGKGKAAREDGVAQRRDRNRKGIEEGRGNQNSGPTEEGYSGACKKPHPYGRTQDAKDQAQEANHENSSSMETSHIRVIDPSEQGVSDLARPKEVVSREDKGRNYNNPEEGFVNLTLGNPATGEGV